MKKQQILAKIEELQRKLADGDYTDDSDAGKRTIQGQVAIRRNEINRKYGFVHKGISSYICEITSIIMYRSKDYKRMTNFDWDKVHANNIKVTARLRTYCEILKNEDLYFAIYDDVCRTFAELFKKYGYT